MICSYLLLRCCQRSYILFVHGERCCLVSKNNYTNYKTSIGVNITLEHRRAADAPRVDENYRTSKYRQPESKSQLLEVSALIWNGLGNRVVVKLRRICTFTSLG